MSDLELKVEDSLIKALQGEDEIGLVIRAHIHIEADLTGFLELFASAEHLDRVRLSYHQRVSLAIALGLKEEHAAPLYALGNLRNAFAHRLDTELSDDRVNGIYSTLSGDHKQTVQEAYERTESAQKKHEGRKFSELPARDRFTLIAVSLNALLIVAKAQVQRSGPANRFK